jgi:hypothetical protein
MNYGHMEFVATDITYTLTWLQQRSHKTEMSLLTQTTLQLSITITSQQNTACHG